MKLVALYGGSFNPSTTAHRDIGELILKQTPVDEVWYLVSPQNPFKPPEGMAPFPHRVAMARLNVEDNPRLKVEDIEARYAATKPTRIIETSETLQYLMHDFPDHRFVWIMGADNLITFHSWGNSHFIMEHVPLLVLPRPGYTEAAMISDTASMLEKLENPADIRTNNGWYMIAGEGSPTAATNCKAELAQGQIPTDMRPTVANYALGHGIYAPALTIK